jgi:hypothetical protein
MNDSGGTGQWGSNPRAGDGGAGMPAAQQTFASCDKLTLCQVTLSERAMLHDMSKEFWHGIGWVFLISAIVVPITGWYLDFGGFFVFAAFLGCFMGAVYMLQLGNASESKTDRPE